MDADLRDRTMDIQLMFDEDEDFVDDPDRVVIAIPDLELAMDLTPRVQILPLRAYKSFSS